MKTYCMHCQNDNCKHVVRFKTAVKVIDGTRVPVGYCTGRGDRI